MEEFNQDVWNSWLVSGFKFIRYRKINNNSAYLKPYKEVDSEAESKGDTYFLRIMDEEVGEMALNSIPLLKDFKFYIEEWD